MRKAFLDTLNDKQFMEEAERAKLEITPVSGAEVQALVADIYSTPRDIAEKAGALMHMLGWAVRRTSEPGRPRKYVRPKASQRQTMPGGSPGSTAGPARPAPANPEDDDGPPF